MLIAFQHLNIHIKLMSSLKNVPFFTSLYDEWSLKYQKLEQYQRTSSCRSTVLIVVISDR